VPEPKTDQPQLEEPRLAKACAAEVIGTFLLVFFGTGSVFVAVVTVALQGLGQVAMVWGVAIGLAIYATSAVSGAHLNPAVTIAATLLRGFCPRRVLPYIAAQVGGAILASALLFTLFSGGPGRIRGEVGHRP
jgi:glycerol uptake facilitator protein